MRYSIELLKSYQSAYSDPPYPGFSLEEVFEKRREHTLALRRTDHAYTLKKPTNTREENKRRVTSELNKLTDANFEKVMVELRRREFFLEEDYRKDLVDAVFTKALNEPECSKQYAATSRSLASYEIDVRTNKGEREPRSRFRSELVEKLRQTYMKFLDEEEPLPMTAEEREDLHTRVMRRKRSTMRFIGELYLHDVLSFKAMHSTVEQILEREVLAEDNVEVLVELLTTIGERFSKERQQSITMALNKLDRMKELYTPRIRFMIMDLLDLPKSGWKKRADTKRAKSAASPMASRAPERFPSPNSTQSSKWSRDGHTRNNTTGTSFSPASPTSKSSSKSAPAAAAVKVPVFSAVVRKVQEEWLEGGDREFITNWIDAFNRCDRRFRTEEEVGEAVAAEVILAACKTTKARAQEEAFSFLSVALDLSDQEILGGFSTSLATAINEDYTSDVPKLPERWMTLLTLASSSLADLVYDLGCICRDAFNHKISSDLYAGSEEDFEELLSTLQLFWRCREATEEDERVASSAVADLTRQAEDSKPGIEKLLGTYLLRLHAGGILEADCFAALHSESDPLTQQVLFFAESSL